ncbi:protein DEHYDRATION-INDUCED 19-like [Solanum pennellii]|uniref:Protein DEHYDRATION-INDUCED 19-like n=1 Tax=Solanum pennellii TaxID=28526 RepID=A0ABM1G506_SOLPN|nr:protein DEHYDRATION-INDUCED 19-like [Solanum pennellii]XP_015066087.1 protein DEHYDRATION-INDUCED 19-like [Solanum pennellii]
MDSDFWTSRLAAAKRQLNLQQNHSYNHQTSQLDRLSIDDFEVEEEVRPDFPCPYCYEDFDIASLCSHLEEEHSCESRVTVCPICSHKVSRDMLSHITVQHGHLLRVQRRRRLRKVAIPSSQALSLLGRDLREAHLQVLLGGSGYRSSTATSTTAAAANDPFLSSLVLNYPTFEAEEISKSVLSSVEDSTTKNVTSQHIWKLSFDPSLSVEEREKRISQATGRAVFVQDLFASSLLAD